MNTLIVYWSEDVHFYLIPDHVLSEEQVQLIERSAGKMINTDTYDEDPEACDYLSVALSKPEHCNGESHAGVWRQYRVDESVPCRTNISRVVLTGFAP